MTGRIRWKAGVLGAWLIVVLFLSGEYREGFLRGEIFVVVVAAAREETYSFPTKLFLEII